MGEVDPAAVPGGSNSHRNVRSRMLDKALMVCSDPKDVVPAAKQFESYLKGEDQEYDSSDDAPEYHLAWLNMGDGQRYRIIKTQYGWWRAIDSGSKVTPEQLEEHFQW